jgi:ABC-type multidrug transport system fused ATPase/permease subunit
MSLQTIITVLGIIAVSLWIRSYAKKKGNEVIILSDDKKQLKSHIIYCIAGFLCVITFLGLLISLIYSNFEIDLNTKEPITSYFIIYGVLFMFAALGTYSLLYYYNHKVVYNSNEIIVHNAFKNCKIIKWENISDVTFNAGMNEYTFHTSENTKVKISSLFYGLEDFKNEFIKHSPFLVEKMEGAK